jgi:hypothetical protein
LPGGARRTCHPVCLMTRDNIRAERVMPFEADKIMFEIYREATYSGSYRVVYFTELQDYNKESEINRAMAGDHFCDGFIRNYRKDQAKEVINGILERLNSGETLTPADVECELKEFVPA